MAKKILTIANKIIFPTSDGGSMAMKNLTLMLKKKEYSIDIISISKNNNKNSTKPSKLIIDNQITQITFKKNMCFNLIKFIASFFQQNAYQATRFYDIKIKEYIQKLIDKNQYEVILFESVFSTIYLKELKLNKKTIKIFRAHNLEHEIWANLANNQLLKKSIFLLLSRQIKKTEEKIGNFVDYILTISEFDKIYFDKIYSKKTINIPVTFKTHNNKINKINNSIYHLGAMDWQPNRQGIKWFIKHIKPSLEKQNIKIYIAGKNMPEYYFKYRNPNTIIEGKVDNVESYIQNKEILFVPLFSGSGIRIKILEAMAHGIPVVSTSKGAQGIPYTNGENILIADKKEVFINSIIKLTEDKNLAKKIGDNGKKLINLNFSESIVIDKLNNII